jgi:L-ascorbate metabolism protein UlaG (beta-lactamase superfamily)
MWGDKMDIFWYGHSFFKIVIEDKVIFVDPYDESVGYSIPGGLFGNVVLESHQHYDHNNDKIISGDYQLIKKSGHYDLDTVRITGLDTYHDSERGKKRGDNIVFVIESKNYRIVHLGDLGCYPEDSFYDRVYKPDVLMVPVGGIYTIDKEIAFSIVEKVDPKLVIPMHYKTEKLKFDLESVEGFIKMFNNVFYEEALNIKNPEELKRYNNDLMVLEYLG